jgi:hypothetical protein
MNVRRDFLGVKQKALSHGRARGANDHVKQSHTILFADNAVGFTYYCFIAMLANVIHTFFYGNENAKTGVGSRWSLLSPEVLRCQPMSSTKCHKLYEGNNCSKKTLQSFTYRLF